MMILPDRNAPVGKLLLPMKRGEWRTPSHAQSKDRAGNENQTRFRLTGRLDDGCIAWRGWFDDREDADAFLFAVLTGSIMVDLELWRLPAPNWHPDFGEHLIYDFAAVTFLTTTGAGTYTVPGDWNNLNNKVETVGGAGGGARGQNGVTFGAGGGGGAYSAVTNLVLTPGASATTNVGAAGPGGATASSGGSTGGDTWFNGANLAASSVGSKGGAGGGIGVPATGGIGGAAASGIGATKFSGGAGSPTVAANSEGGGGGSASPNGNGAAGGPGRCTA